MEGRKVGYIKYSFPEYIITLDGKPIKYCEIFNDKLKDEDVRKEMLQVGGFLFSSTIIPIRYTTITCNENNLEKVIELVEKLLILCEL